jgi:peptide/nickel transport system substrate-binding protein
VTVAVPYLPTNFNPSTPKGANSVTQMVMEQVWPQAFVVDPEFEAETQGFIDSAEVVGLRPMTVSYVIDPKATWSDGYPITAADFVYNWQQRLLTGAQLASAGVLAGYRDILSIAGSNGGKTVTVIFKSAYADWEGLFANLVPAHIAEKSGWSTAFAGFDPGDVISGGPFIISSVEPGKRLVLTRNVKYWGPPAHLQSIVFLVEHTERDTLTGLGNGSVSIAQLPPAADLDAMVARDDTYAPQLSIATTATPDLWQLNFNLNAPVVDNPLMRQALALSTDRDQLVADSVGLDDPATSGAESRIFSDGEPGAGSEGSSLGYNPVGAAALFKALGYLPDQNGVLRDNGVGAPLTLTITGPEGDAVAEALELQLQAEWAACGVTLVIHNVTMTRLLSVALPEGRYEIALAPYVIPTFPSWAAIDYTDPVTPAPAPQSTISLHGGSSSPGTAGSGTGNAWWWSVSTPQGTEPGAVTAGAVTRDVTGLNQTGVSTDFEQIMVELNTQSEAVLMSKLDGLLTHYLPTLPLFQTPVSLVQRSDIVNVSESPTSAGPMWDAEDWVIELTATVG